MEDALKFDIQKELLACLPDMHAFARFLAKDYERADDLVQEATVRVLAAADQFEPGTNFKAWVFTILRNLYYNELQKNKRFVDNGGDSDKFEFLSALASTQESSLDFRDFYRVFWQLDENHREVLMLVGASGLSYEDAASVCGCQVGTIKSRVSRARRDLRERLEAAKKDAATAEPPAPSV
jgi:RNA polymerase sigma-70 factor (ECF subfamily)